MRVLFTAIAAVAIASCATGTAAQVSSLALAPGEGVTLTIDASGAVREFARTDDPSALSPTERDVMAGLRDNDAAMGQNVIPMVASAGSESEPIEADRIKIRFLIVHPNDSVLMIENGYDLALTYRASILVNHEMRPTDVCLVLPSRHGVEHWPYLIDHIELSQLTLQPWREGDPVTCR